MDTLNWHLLKIMSYKLNFILKKKKKKPNLKQ
jgi:hypothetical protein